MDPYERLQICDVVNTHSFKQGEKICKQGEIGTRFFILLEGEADAISITYQLVQKTDRMCQSIDSQDHTLENSLY